MTAIVCARCGTHLAEVDPTPPVRYLPVGADLHRYTASERAQSAARALNLGDRW